MVASGSMTLANLLTGGGGGAVSLTANQINVGGTVDSGSRPLGINAVAPINLAGEIGSVDIRLSGRSGLAPTTGAGISSRSVSLGSGVITLASGGNPGGATSGQITISSAGEIVGSPGVTVVAPVPVPAAFLLFATGLAALGLVKRPTA